VVEREMDASVSQVFDAMSDAWLFPTWVVGATHIRDVDDNWPQPGSQLHHKLGAWPVALSDTTTVVECKPPDRLTLRGRAYPFGEVCIELRVTSRRDKAVVRMAEGPIRGLAQYIDNPLQRRLLLARNRESLDRLAAIAEHRRLR
jgi:uncharacterized protein YndB with AHSA1/START domain